MRYTPLLVLSFATFVVAAGCRVDDSCESLLNCSPVFVPECGDGTQATAVDPITGRPCCEPGNEPTFEGGSEYVCADGTGGGGTGGAPTGGGGTGGAPTCTEDPTLCMGNTPVCLNGTCVTCTPAEDDACMGQTPVCDAATNECRACAYHADCPESACNPFTGACLDATPQTVGPDAGDDFPTLSAALVSVAENGEAVFLLSPNTANTAYQESLTVVSRTVAVLSEGGRPALQGVALPTITVANGATLLLEGVDVTLNGASRGITADGLVALDRVEVTQNNGGGIQASSSAELLVRNTIVAANGQVNEDAIILNGSTATFLYSSIAGVADPSSRAIACTGGTLSVRNSILLKRDATGDPVEGCTGATVENTSSTNIDNTNGLAWFSGWASDLRLTPAGVTQFGTVAEWQAGDPPTDIDGTARPDTAGTADVAGAHLGP